MKLDEFGRMTGSFLVIGAYFVILHVNVRFGAAMHIVGDLVSVPFFVRTKSWDIVIMLMFLLSISLSKLLAVDL